MSARKAILLIDKSIDRALTVFFLILLLIGLYFVTDAWYLFNASSLQSLPGFTPKNPAQIKQIAKDAIAWISVDETSISYPIMQGADNSEYLNKNAQGEYSLSGAIFLDSNNNPEFTDYYSILYGHHMTGGYMFGALDYFEDEKYFDEHRKGTLLVINGKKYELNMFAFVETDASEDVVFDVTVGGDIMGFIASHASIYRPPEGDRILALSTCKSPLTTERTVVFATTKFVEEVGEGKPLTQAELEQLGTDKPGETAEDTRHPLVKLIEKTMDMIIKAADGAIPKEDEPDAAGSTEGGT